MPEFISNLGYIIGSSQGRGVLEGYPQPRVADKTGLTGTYTFILQYYSANTARLIASLQRNAQPPAADTGATASEPEGGVSIFRAVQKQLGLRLDKTADIPLDVIVVESVDKAPTAN